MRRSGLILTGVASLGIIGALAAVVLDGSSGSSPSGTGRLGVQAAVDRPPSGGPDVAPSTSPELADEAPLFDTRLPLRLLGTVVASLQADAPPLSLAVIEDEGTLERQVVRKGDRLASDERVSVAEIEPTQVQLLRGDRLEVLRLESGRGRAAPITESDLAALVEGVATGRGPREASRIPDADPENELAADLQDLAIDDGGVRSGPALLSQGRFSPAFDESHDQILGMQIRDIEPGGFYDLIGLADGDVITVVNGIEIQTIDAANEMLLEFSQAGDLEIELQSSAHAIRVTREQMDELLNR